MVKNTKTLRPIRTDEEAEERVFAGGIRVIGTDELRRRACTVSLDVPAREGNTPLLRPNQ